MNQYVITLNAIDNGNLLMQDYETIEGSTPKDALRNRFGVNFERLTGERGAYAEIALVKGQCQNNNITYKGRYQSLYFRRERPS